MFGAARRGGPADAVTHSNPQHSSARHRIHGTSTKLPAFLVWSHQKRVVMYLSANRKQGRLPKRFPVGTTYVVEGRGDPEGHLCIFSRYVVLPGGERINLGGELGAAATPRNRRARSGSPRAAQKVVVRRPGKRRSERTKKIMATAGTTRLRRR
jgi:hypothetical protein